MNYTHLSQEERYQIYALKRAGHGQSEIAGILNRSPSTISRELRRNGGERGYRPKQELMPYSVDRAFWKSAFSKKRSMAWFQNFLCRQ